MPRIPGTNDRQTTFLRAFRNNPSGPPPESWPSPAILRRWLRRPAFRAALDSLRQTLQFQSDFHLAAAASAAVQSLAAPDAPASSARRLENLLRLAHLRQRFTSQQAIPEPEPLPEPKSKSKSKPTTPAKDVPAFRLRFDGLPILSDKDLWKLASNAGYLPSLQKRPSLPPPVPQDTFYYHLLHHPGLLLYYLDQYDKSCPHLDHRFEPILIACKHLIPTERPEDDRFLPRLAPDPQADGIPNPT
jgi:hypothetical protein